MEPRRWRLDKNVSAAPDLRDHHEKVDVEDFRRPEHQPGAYWHRDDTITEGHDDHGLDMYLEEFELTVEQLEGKVIVDIGIGKSNKFARELRARGINATVIGISPDLKDPLTREMVNTGDPVRSVVIDRDARVEEGSNLLVAGIAQMLPLAAGSTDLVLANYSLSYYHMSSGLSAEADAWIGELGRVLKHGGEARVQPVYPDNKRLPISEIAAKHGLSYEVAGSGLNTYHRFVKIA